MKVKTLIKQLQKLPPNFDVVVVNTDWEDEGILNRVVIRKRRGPTSGLSEKTAYLEPKIVEHAK